MRNRRAPSCALALSLLLLAATPTGDAAPTIDAQLAGARVRIPLAALAERVPLAPGQDFRVVELGRDADTSHHLVAIRTAETPHRHDHHDLLVVMQRGHGTMRIGDETLPVGEHSILYVPRGTAHAFANTSAEPAISYVVYTPPFDGVDRVEVAR
jgi:mannose-6-phosphate isomerase-like protein (cupin superfamily)